MAHFAATRLPAYDCTEGYPAPQVKIENPDLSSYYQIGLRFHYLARSNPKVPKNLTLFTVSDFPQNSWLNWTQGIMTLHISIYATYKNDQFREKIRKNYKRVIFFGPFKFKNHFFLNCFWKQVLVFGVAISASRHFS